ncbi:septum site-determining protein MinC [Hypnocyclicus thermotrophus]|uniref:Septum site-determining protein MinC n=1 Tax=Hypnocyclicus thermotrophus TaxID=1627895 RepID=A0AA46I5B4_9FUSO|nr:septum site-determining protein MinC [Hypnocyclicus thermotrophus]TDT69763.1 septum site-determining protein MinC [Hypnocyclicus thermotrophus]
MLKYLKDGILIKIEDYEKNILDLKENIEKNFFDVETDFLLERKNKKYYKDIYNILNEKGHFLYLIKDITPQIIYKKVQIIEKKIHSGQKIEIDGDVILLGDLNIGAELIATGSVFIFGKAKGFIHAGSKGNNKAIVVANEINLNHIKIANIMAKYPKIREVSVPEKISLNNNKIEVERLNENEFKKLLEKSGEKIEEKKSFFRFVFNKKRV